jgi:catecholate siderophore receptor
VDVNQTLGAWDGAAVRFNTFYDGGDRPDRDVADSGRWGFAPSLALGLGGETRAFFNFLFIKQNNTPDGGLPTIGILGYASSSTEPGVAAAVNAADPVDRGNYYGSLADYEHVHANMFTARLEHDLSANATLRNTSRYGRTTLQRVITGVNTLGNLSTGSGVALVVNDPSEWTISRSRQGRDEVNEILTNQ